MKPNERHRRDAARKKTRAARRQQQTKVPKSDTVPRMYPGETAVLLATGPSLCDADIKYIRPFHEQGKIRVFGLGDSYRICDFLDVFYACDPKWFDCNPGVLKHPCKQKWTQDKNAAKYGCKRVSGSSGQGLSVRDSHIHFGSNSGFQLLNLALHYGITRFLLLGYNMDVPKGQQQHFFGKHPKPLNQGNNYRGFAAQFEKIAPQHKSMVINCTYPTMLKCFTQMPLEKALGEPRSSKPVKSTTEEPTLPRESGRTFIPGVYGGPRGDRTVTRRSTTVPIIPVAYGGPSQSIHDQ